MANYKFVVSDPKSKKSYQLEVEQAKVSSIVGKKIGEEFDGEGMGLSGYTLQITGGSDKDGFPMIKDVSGPAKRRALLTKAPGFHPRIEGMRKRKTIRGNTVSEDTMQINTKVIKAGSKTLDEITGKTPEAPKDAPEAKADAPKEAPAKESPKPEAKKEEAKPAPVPEKKEVKEEKPAEKTETPAKPAEKTEEKKE